MGSRPKLVRDTFVAEVRVVRAGEALPLMTSAKEVRGSCEGKDLESWWCPGLAGEDFHQDQGSLAATWAPPSLLRQVLRRALGWWSAFIFRGRGNLQRTGGELHAAEQVAMSRIPNSIVPHLVRASR